VIGAAIVRFRVPAKTGEIGLLAEYEDRDAARGVAGTET
jgi:hypothetical protein